MLENALYSVSTRATEKIRLTAGFSVINCSSTKKALHPLYKQDEGLLVAATGIEPVTQGL
jgi:hypothetical protein